MIDVPLISTTTETVYLSDGFLLAEEWAGQHQGNSFTGPVPGGQGAGRTFYAAPKTDYAVAEAHIIASYVNVQLKPTSANKNARLEHWRYLHAQGYSVSALNEISTDHDGEMTS